MCFHKSKKGSHIKESLTVNVFAYCVLRASELGCLLKTNFKIIIRISNGICLFLILPQNKAVSFIFYLRKLNQFSLIRCNCFELTELKFEFTWINIFGL